MIPLTGLIISSTGSWYLVELENGEEVSARLRGKFRLKGKTLTNPIAVGDKVLVEHRGDDYVIVEIEPRGNYIIRKSAKLSSQFQIVAANLDQAIILFTFQQPRTSLGFLDRFLVTCECFGIPPVIVFNKCDLWEGGDEKYSETNIGGHKVPTNAEEPKNLPVIISFYKDLGYSVYVTSLTGHLGTNNLIPQLANKTSLLFGHSGAGKSTLLNSVVPNAGQQIAEISEFHGKGRHTTTSARMFKGTQGVRLIDTPGIKEFGLDTIESWKIAHYFPEFKPLIPNCRFNNCLHLNEPDCAILRALSNGELEMSRYESYFSIINEQLHSS